ncbi:WecB/TagA/CpsF family glycosyltransferase [Mangrovibacterium sp.]|uniref:WecB/TagA/CpsF family glycosyltransferase n=1 Tax=Mangrovibacterium sp. TaxID=1961364 RepID=UPI003567AA9A
MAKRDPDFKKALLGSDVLLPDGESVVIGAKVLGAGDVHKIAGFDLFYHLMQRLESNSGSCYFLGASDQTLLKIQNRIKLEFPNVRVGVFSPPFKPKFSDEDSELMCHKVNSFMPDVLFVGMTAPKQEKWVHEHHQKIKANVICSIGAVFDFYAGTTHRPPLWMINMRLEWLGRLILEPKRMWRRYFLSTPVFLIDICKYRLGLFQSKRNKSPKTN